MSRYSRERCEHFRSRYDREDSEASKTLAALALGDDVGVNGYTTIEQAERLSRVLGVSSGALVLDLGSGRGWPGTHVSQACGCHAVLTDLPVDPLREARSYARVRGVSKRVSMVCAEGTALPFADLSFEAVTHADVLC